MKAGDRVLVELGPQHPAQLRRAVPAVCELVALDPPWAEIRAAGPQIAPVETYLVPILEISRVD